MERSTRRGGRRCSCFPAATTRDGEFRYAPDKWNAKEVLGHVCDTERVFAYRALRIARGDQTPTGGFEQDDYVRNGPFAKRTAGRGD